MTMDIENVIIDDERLTEHEVTRFVPLAKNIMDRIHGKGYTYQMLRALFEGFSFTARALDAGLIKYTENQQIIKRK